MRKLILCFLILSLWFTVSSCATTGTIVYKDVPADCMVIKRDTLSRIIGELIITKQELMECLERERGK